jgi:transcription elongation factor Elf1
MTTTLEIWPPVLTDRFTRCPFCGEQAQVYESAHAGWRLYSINCECGHSDEIAYQQLDDTGAPLSAPVMATWYEQL